jgi:hypothetical protein
MAGQSRFRACSSSSSAAGAGASVFIISHKTRRPFLGELHDLHAAALNWLEQQGFFAGDGIGLPRNRVFFELTKEAKLARIGECQCTHFLDDLPEFLGEPAFPKSVRRVLFDPNGLYAEETRFVRVTSWTEAGRVSWAEGGEAPESAAADVSWRQLEPRTAVCGDRAERTTRPAGLKDLRAAVARSWQSTAWGRLHIDAAPGGANNRAAGAVRGGAPRDEGIFS